MVWEGRRPIDTYLFSSWVRKSNVSVRAGKPISAGPDAGPPPGPRGVIADGAVFGAVDRCSC